MEKEAIKNNNNGNHHYNNNNNQHRHNRERHGLGIASTNGNSVAGLTNNNSSNNRSNPGSGSSDFVLQWGNRKRLRCMKFQAKDDSDPAHKTTVRIDRRVVRSTDKNNNTIGGSGSGGGGYFNLRQRPISPPLPPVPQPQRVLRNSEAAMRGQQNGDHNHHKTTADKKGNNNNHNHHQSKIGNGGGGGNGGGVSGASSETAVANEFNKKGGSSSGSDGKAIPVVWPPKFMIALTTKEKEEDFMAIKGSKLPQRPKKRAKLVQRTLNLVSPGAWLCDLTLDRYEVREKKINKKRPRGLKAMGTMDSDSE